MPLPPVCTRFLTDFHVWGVKGEMSLDLFLIHHKIMPPTTGQMCELQHFYSFISYLKHCHLHVKLFENDDWKLKKLDLREEVRECLFTTYSKIMLCSPSWIFIFCYFSLRLLLFPAPEYQRIWQGWHPAQSLFLLRTRVKIERPSNTRVTLSAILIAQKVNREKRCRWKIQCMKKGWLPVSWQNGLIEGN